jgi:general stress protein YciG
VCSLRRARFARFAYDESNMLRRQHWGRQEKGISMIDGIIHASPEEVKPEGSTAPEQRPRKRRGFAAMDPRKVSEIASKGGKAAHRAGTAHEFTPEEAREAGRKGGYATHAKRKAAGTSSAPPTPRSSEEASPESEPGAEAQPRQEKH